MNRPNSCGTVRTSLGKSVVLSVVSSVSAVSVHESAMSVFSFCSVVCG